MPTNRSCKETSIRHLFSIVVVLLLVSGCGDKQTPSSPAIAPQPRPPLSGAAKAPEPASGTTGPTPAVGLSPQANSQPQPFAGRTGELNNPDHSTMVFLYHDLSGIKPSIDDWVEKDSRVQSARAMDKPSQRDKVRVELESGLAAVRGIGVIRLSLSAGLSDYDPTYGEFTVQALAPSSVVTFDAFGEKVSLQFGNGKTAQTWRVPAADAQTIRDKIGYNGVNLSALVKIKAVQPGPGGGTITADVLEYELREGSRSALIVGRVKVGQQ
jgi:hypothetical protein